MQNLRRDRAVETLYTEGPTYTKEELEDVYANYPPDLSAEQEQFLVTTVKDWAIQRGLAVRPSPTALPAGADPKGVLATNAPVTLFPSPFPKECFREALHLQKEYNILYAAISRNEEWLGNIMEE